MPQTALPPDLQGSLVVAVDDSPPARRALRFAVRLAAGLHRPVDVVLVWNFVMGPAPERRSEVVDERDWQRQAERALQAFADDVLGEDCGVEVRLHAVHGNTVPTLLAISEVAEHLVVASRGRGGFTGLLLGSTTDQLVRHAACPVTVVPPKAEQRVL